ATSPTAPSTARAPIAARATAPPCFAAIAGMKGVRCAYTTNQRESKDESKKLAAARCEQAAHAGAHRAARATDAGAPAPRGQGRRARRLRPDHHARCPARARLCARRAHGRAIFGGAKIPPPLVSRRAFRRLGLGRSQLRVGRRPRRLCRGGENGTPGLPPPALSRGSAGAGREQL